jgi:uncharacterized membrane protein
MRLMMLAAVLTAASPTLALAQNADLRASHGEISLNSGFTPDPRRVSVTAGGPIEADPLGDGCRGEISNAPSVQVTYRAGSFPLVFRTLSDSDTTLVVRAPNGRWSCDDDSWIDGDEEIRFDSPASGAYDVWVGTYAGGTAPASLLITETPGSEVASAPASATVDLRVCNESGRPASVAVSYVEVGTGRFVNRGWYEVANGACSSLVSTDNANFYMYADAMDGSGRSWSGGHTLCVQYPGPYTFYSTGAEYCEPGQEVRNFVPMTAEETGEYTWTLNP